MISIDQTIYSYPKPCFMQYQYIFFYNSRFDPFTCSYATSQYLHLSIPLHLFLSVFSSSVFFFLMLLFMTCLMKVIYISMYEQNVQQSSTVRLKYKYYRWRNVHRNDDIGTWLSNLLNVYSCNDWNKPPAVIITMRELPRYWIKWLLSALALLKGMSWSHRACQPCFP